MPDPEKKITLESLLAKTELNYISLSSHKVFSCSMPHCCGHEKYLLVMPTECPITRQLDYYSIACMCVMTRSIFFIGPDSTTIDILE